MDETPDNVVDIATKKNPRIVNGKKLTGAAGRKLTPEMQAKLAAGRERAKAEGRMGKPRTKFTKREREEKNLETLDAHRTRAIQEFVDILEDDQAPRKLRFDAAKLILEYTDGKPTQKVEVEQVERIVYELAEHEPAPAAASGE